MLEKLIAIAAAQVGTKEVGGNNCGQQIREFQSATDFSPGPWAWCAAFVDWCIREWLKDAKICILAWIEK
jgi:hypothetical protein